MPSSDYQAVPTTAEEESAETRPQVAADRFTQRPVPWWKRVLLILFIVLLGGIIWLLKDVRNSLAPKVVYADRYSAEFRYRPAASPVITETLNSGRTLLIRGAHPTARRAHNEL
ncbi:hypothetical protein DACRYDRAFT_117951 [Dacryopinax primogenitus]|uniref:Uncharacterized protein n=1 Tax=Dacryopinax primogenitus (strain DJM 731) TaxID=1858805 RepID=M5FT43_DACPD|nr:uncharacterized protein DACRYDRAFT_117951 [Dacryopinax primogenitus]EJT99168.1 hypothetical protein DACRYDRAFT_117951 [Dacryopinax primogenitus]